MFTRFLNREEISPATREKYYYRLRGFVAQHADEEPGSIKPSDVLCFINVQDLAEPSRALLRAAFHAFFAFCGLGDDNPAKALPRWRDTPKRVILPKEQAVKLAMAEAVKMCSSSNPVDVRDGLIFSLAVVSGNRRDEIRRIKVVELQEALDHPEANGIYRVFTTGKTGECVLRFTDFHVPHIMRYLKYRPSLSEYLFVTMDKRQKIYGQQLSLVTYNRIRPKICRRAGVNVITYQELRRRLATTIARTVNVDVAAQALNHSPHSGDRVIRLFYFDPDKAAVDEAALAVFGRI